jgi:hypothetical protein
MAMTAIEASKNAEMPKEIFGVPAQRVPVQGGDASRENKLTDLHNQTRGNDVADDNRSISTR